MKKIISSALVLASLFVASEVSAQSAKTDTIKVSGNCGMCKKRIETAAKADGVSNATWDEGTKLLLVTYNPSKITNEAIQKKVAAVGHDTENAKATDGVYSKLPGCCHYDRKAGNKQ
ncbi:MAG: cation transporter [Chitinophagaceae bacterium]